MPSEATDTRPTRDELAARVRQLEAQVSTPDVSRRGALAALLGAGSMAALSQPVAAQSDDQGAACTWLGDQDAAGYDLFGLSHTFMGTVSDTPADDEYASDEVAVYVKDDDNLYLRPNGGNEELVSGSSSGALVDSGSDTDGGDDYVMPTAADNIDLQNDGGLRNADVVSTDRADVKDLNLGSNNYPPIVCVASWEENSTKATKDSNAGGEKIVCEAIDDLEHGNMSPSMRVTGRVKIGSGTESCTIGARLVFKTANGDITIATVSTSETSFVKVDSGWVDMTDTGIVSASHQDDPFTLYVHHKSSDGGTTGDLESVRAEVGLR